MTPLRGSPDFDSHGDEAAVMLASVTLNALGKPREGPSAKPSQLLGKILPISSLVMACYAAVDPDNLPAATLAQASQPL